MKARTVSERVGIVTYRDPIPELEATKDLLKLDVRQRTYQTLEDARDSFRSLEAQGYRVIVGSSVVVDLAEQNGIVGILAYSPASVRQAIDDAIEIARIAHIESARYEQLNVVLHHLQEAVLAVDASERITAINPAMERMIGIASTGALGRALSELAPALSLRGVLSSGEQALERVVQLNLATCVANAIPIRERTRSTRLPATTRPCWIRSSSAGAATMTRSAGSPRWRRPGMVLGPAPIDPPKVVRTVWPLVRSNSGTSCW